MTDLVSERRKMKFNQELKNNSLVTVSEIVDLYSNLGLTRRMVIYAITQGKLLAVQWGGKGVGRKPYVTTEEEVERWIDRTYKTNI